MTMPVACDDSARPVVTSRETHLSAFAADAPLPRRWAARLSVPVREVPCVVTDSTPFAELSCESRGSIQLAERVIAVAARISARDDSTLDADAAHAVALIDLVSADTARKSLDRSVNYLDMLTRLAAPSASVLSDLSAAHLARATRLRDAREVLAALDAASRALEIDATYAPALFNRALALEAITLDRQAALAWRRYIAVDSTTHWSQEARAHLAAPRSHDEFAAPNTDASDEVLRVYARQSATAAQTFAWETLLGEWGRATQSGSQVVAEARLHSAAIVGERLAERGEFSTSDAVRAIKAALSLSRADSRTVTLHRLATAHALYAAAQERVRRNEFARADSIWRRVLAAPPPSPALTAWCRFWQANTTLALLQTERADHALRDVLRTTNSERYPSVVARALWAAGIIQLREGNTGDGLELLHRARDIFARLQQVEPLAVMLGIEGEARLRSGEDLAGYTGLLDALWVMRATPNSVNRHNALMILARATSTRGLPRAALAIYDEDAAMTSASPITRAEAELTRARVVATAGLRSLLADAVTKAESAIARIPEPNMRTQMHHELGVIRAPLVLANRPQEAIARLDSALAVLEPLGNSGKTLPALIARAEATVVNGDEKAAERDLQRAADIYLRNTGNLARSTASSTQRATLLASRVALLNQARPVFDSLVVMRLRRGGKDAGLDALRLMERWRASFSLRSAITATDVPRKPELPAIAYAMIGNEIIAWGRVGAGVAVKRTPVDRTRLRQTVERARASLERGDDARVWQPELAQLYDWLLRPVEEWLGPDDSTVGFVLDAAVADVPFAALYDARRKRYFVEAHASRFAASWGATALDVDVRALKPFRRAVVVSNPTLGVRSFPALVNLPLADSEAFGVAQRYPGARRLFNGGADNASVSKSMQRADLFHFAGHAVFDDARPEQSMLALEPRGLTASAIAQMRLPALRLAVLSACEMTRGGDASGSGFSAMTSAFMEAGADGVVGTLWRADDAATANFMIRFHDNLSQSADVPNALRDAQRAMVRRSPSEWGGFRYAGR